MHVQTCTALLLSVVGNVLLYVFDCTVKNFNYLPVPYRHSFSFNCLLKNKTEPLCKKYSTHCTAALLSRVGPYFLNAPPHSPHLPLPMSNLWNSHRPVMFMSLTPFLWMPLLLILQRCLRFCHLHTQMDGTSSVCLIVTKTQLELMVLFLFVCFVSSF